MRHGLELRFVVDRKQILRKVNPKSPSTPHFPRKNLANVSDGWKAFPGAELAAMLGGRHADVLPELFREIGLRTRRALRGCVGPVCDWLAAQRGRDWRGLFPVLAGYPCDLFDYAAEDRFLAQQSF
jgi:hypothetical protein